MAKKLNETEARQGSRGRPVLLVLIAGVAILVVGYLLIGGIGVATSPEGSLEQSEQLEAPDGDTTEVEGDTVTPDEAEPQQNGSVAVPD